MTLTSFSTQINEPSRLGVSEYSEVIEALLWVTDCGPGKGQASGGLSVSVEQTD